MIVGKKPIIVLCIDIALENILASWTPLCSAIIKVVGEEDDVSVACAMLLCVGDVTKINQTVKTIDAPCMNPEQLSKLMEELKKQLEQYMIRSAERNSKLIFGK